MAAGGGAGVVTVWNLEARRLHAVLRDAHDAPVTALHFFPGEPRLMSAGRDNALKQWVLDDAGEAGAARLLRFRSGHAAPPTVLRYYGETGTRLLSAGAGCLLLGCLVVPKVQDAGCRISSYMSAPCCCVTPCGRSLHEGESTQRHAQPRSSCVCAGQDRTFRMFSTIQDQQSSELSQGHIAKRAKRLRVEQQELKLPRLTALDACQVSSLSMLLCAVWDEATC